MALRSRTRLLAAARQARCALLGEVVVRQEAQAVRAGCV